VTANGGLIPYDLHAPAQLLIPRYHPFIDASTPEGRAELARRRAEAEAEAARVQAATATARAGWAAARERLAGNVPAVLVLDLHRPEPGYDGPACAGCMTSGYEEAEPVPWPCDTYQAVTSA
jgi:hypothetical protein